jgi:cell division septation protein DedD
MENKPSSNRRISSKSVPKHYMTLSRWGAYGWLMSFFVLSGCMFIIGVVIGRNTAPVFDMDQMDAKMGRLKNSSLQQIEKGIEAAQQQKKHYLEVAKNIDIFEPLKEKGKNLLAYKQYLPPLKAPKYDKNEKPKDEAASADQTPMEQPAAQPQEMDLAQAQPMGQQVQGNAAPETESVQVVSEPAPKEKPLAVKEGAPKPKNLNEPAKAPESPLVASLETKAEQTTGNSKVSQAGELPAVAVREPEIGQASTITENQSAANNQQSAAAEQAAKENTPPETPPVEAAPKPPEGSKQYTIQVVSLREVDKATLVRDKFREKGYPAYCQSSPVRGEVWHRVRIGPYPDRAIAEKDCRRLEEAGFDALMLIMNQ